LTIASNAVTTAKIADEAVTLAKLPHGDGSSDGKFLRANNGADPTFESLPASGVTVSNNTNNRVVTGDGTNLNAEANLTFDGSDLAVGAGNINVSKPAIPTVLVQNSTDTSYSTVKLQQSSGSGGYFAINKLGTNSTAVGGANAAQIWQSGNAPIIFGVNNTEEVRFQSGGGISFNGDTAAANALDDYEEGTWSPLWSNASSGGTTVSNNMYGFYTKVGRLVTAHFHTWGLPAPGNSDAMYLQGLPFTSRTIGAVYSAVWSAYFNMGADNYYNLGLRLAENRTYADLYFCRKSSGDAVRATFNGFINYYTNFTGTITYLTT